MNIIKPPRLARIALLHSFDTLEDTMRRTRIFYAETYPKQLKTPVRAYEFKITQPVVGARSDEQMLA